MVDVDKEDCNIYSIITCDYLSRLIEKDDEDNITMHVEACHKLLKLIENEYFLGENGGFMCFYNIKHENIYTYKDICKYLKHECNDEFVIKKMINNLN